MRKVILILSILLISFLAAQVSAADMILMYGNPNTEKVIAKLKPTARLIPVFKKGEWIKVGNPANGTVGWVNRTQVQKAREAFYRPDIQAIYIQRDQAKSGKPEVNIIAYKNGKRLSPAEAKKLYQKMRAQQEKQMKAMRRMTRNMNRMIDSEFFNNNAFWDNQLWAGPMFVFPAPNQKAKPNKSKRKHSDELES